MKVSFKFGENKEAYSILFAGVIILIILAFLASDRREQIFDTLTLLAGFLILLAILIITLPLLMKEIRKSN